MKLCSVLGTPTAATWPDGMRLAAAMDFRFPVFSPTHLSVLVPGASLDALDLLRSLLEWDPARRPTASAVLQHTFFSKHFSPSSPLPAAGTEVPRFLEDGGKEVTVIGPLPGEAWERESPPPPAAASRAPPARAAAVDAAPVSTHAAADADDFDIDKLIDEYETSKAGTGGGERAGGRARAGSGLGSGASFPQAHDDAYSNRARAPAKQQITAEAASYGGQVRPPTLTKNVGSSGGGVSAPAPALRVPNFSAAAGSAYGFGGAALPASSKLYAPLTGAYSSDSSFASGQQRNYGGHDESGGGGYGGGFGGGSSGGSGVGAAGGHFRQPPPAEPAFNFRAAAGGAASGVGAGSAAAAAAPNPFYRSSYQTSYSAANSFAAAGAASSYSTPAPRGGHPGGGAYGGSAFSGGSAYGSGGTGSSYGAGSGGAGPLNFGGATSGLGRRRL